MGFTLTAEDIEVLKRANAAFTQDLDDDYYTPDGCGWRPARALYPDQYLVYEWHKLTGLLLLEGDDTGSYRITEDGRKTVAALRDDRRKLFGCDEDQSLSDPLPNERLCARQGCGNTLRESAVKYGDDLYCSAGCAAIVERDGLRSVLEVIAHYEPQLNLKNDGIKQATKYYREFARRALEGTPSANSVSAAEGSEGAPGGDAVELPEIDVWRSYGERATGHFETKTVDEVLQIYGAEYGKPTPPQSKSFRRGWRYGRIEMFMFSLRLLVPDLSAAQQGELASDLQALVGKYEGMTRQRYAKGGEGAPGETGWNMDDVAAIGRAAADIAQQAFRDKGMSIKSFAARTVRMAMLAIARENRHESMNDQDYVQAWQDGGEIAIAFDREWEARQGQEA